MYYSSYSPSFLDGVAARADSRVEQWCIFDNTASGAAIGDALALPGYLGNRQEEESRNDGRGYTYEAHRSRVGASADA